MYSECSQVKFSLGIWEIDVQVKNGKINPLLSKTA